MLTVLPIRYVADVEASRVFYAALGLEFVPEATVPVWAQFAAGAGGVGLHDAAASQGRSPGSVELGFVTDEPLEAIAARLAAAGIPSRLVEEDFGRSLRVVDPDGVELQLQQIDAATVQESRAARSADDGAASR